MKRVLLAAGALAALALLVLPGIEMFNAQRADYGWSPAIERAAFAAEHPRVLFDEGHHNASTAGFAGRYWPFARLLRADGYDLARGRGAFTPEYLEGARVLGIANASGAGKPQIFGVNIPNRTRGDRGDPAFTAAEIEVIRGWIERGGSLLLIADHAPFGDAADTLGRALGVTMHRGFAEVPEETSDPLLFSADNARLGRHPILAGDGSGTVVSRVHTFTGQSLDGPPGSTELLRFPEKAVEWVRVEGDSLAPEPAGRGQALALELGRGRVVVLGEAAMATAQVSRRVPFGFNLPGNDNAQFVRNVMRWLARGL
jgi:hypothetical protein